MQQFNFVVPIIAEDSEMAEAALKEMLPKDKTFWEDKNLTDSAANIICHGLGLYMRKVEKSIKRIEAQNLPENEDLIRLKENKEEAHALYKNLVRELEASND